MLLIFNFLTIFPRINFEMQKTQNVTIILHKIYLRTAILNAKKPLNAAFLLGFTLQQVLQRRFVKYTNLYLKSADFSIQLKLFRGHIRF
jgi:hypothetical protein